MGTTSQYDGGYTSYTAWYEMYPNDLVITEFNVQPGDSITASVQYNPPGNAGTFLLSLTDNTQGKSFPPLYETNSSAQLSSAEWIVEAPQFAAIAPLPNVGSVTFTGAAATLGTEAGPVDNADWETRDITMVPTKYSRPAFVNYMAPAPPLDSSNGGSTTSTIVVNQLAGTFEHGVAGDNGGDRLRSWSGWPMAKTKSIAFRPTGHWSGGVEARHNLDFALRKKYTSATNAAKQTPDNAAPAEK